MKRTKTEKLSWSMKGHEIATNTLENETRTGTGAISTGTFAEKDWRMQMLTKLQEKSMQRDITIFIILKSLYHPFLMEIL